MRNSGAPKEILALRNAAVCLRVGAKPPYRLRKVGKGAGLLYPGYMDGEEPPSPDSTGKASARAPLKVKQDLS